MWHRLKNFFFSLDTYKVLSPDLRVRQQINRALGDRSALSSDQWFETFYQPQSVAYSVAMFAYRHLGRYSGLEISRVLPTDRLHEDLQWATVCWFDWESQLCYDFYQQFGVDISPCSSEVYWFTIGELVVFLNQAARMENEE